MRHDPISLLVYLVVLIVVVWLLVQLLGVIA
jgi:hypothetical protein